MNKILKSGAIILGAIFILTPFASSQIRKAHFAGHFYPSDKTILTKTLDKYLLDAKKNNLIQLHP